MHESEASTSEYEPIQLVHTLSDVAPVVALAFPGAHAMQSLLEVAERIVLYRPVAHSKQKFEFFAARVGLNLPEAQLMHSDTPEVELNFPAEHAKHVAEDDVEAYRPGVQSVHEFEVDAPKRGLLFPAAQLVHSAIPGAELNFPAAHARQVLFEVAEVAKLQRRADIKATLVCGTINND